MTTIKIHDKQWFKEHCRITGATEHSSYLEPKYPSWRHVRTLPWSLDGDMGQLVGHVLEVELDDGIDSGGMDNARYFAKYWIPNWAIEWVKEVNDSPKGIKCPIKEEALRICDIIAWASKQGYVRYSEAKILCSKIVYNNKGAIETEGR